MTKNIVSPLGIARHELAHTPSKGQQAFNRLIEKIEKRRATLADWEAFGADFRRKFNDELLPLRGSFNTLRIQMVKRLDQAHGTKGLTNAERQIVEELITHVAGDLLAVVDDPAIKEIFQRYNAASAEEEAAAIKMMRDALQDVLRVDIPDDVNFASIDDMRLHFKEQLGQDGERERARHEAKAAHHAKRKQSPKQAAAEERARAEEAEVHLSIREVYRKLASLLHPDREPDPVERERKAVLMQRVNHAYANKSLLDLLELQLELEHIDRSVLESVSEERLNRWNKILKEQLRGLDQELSEIKIEYAIRSGMRPGHPVSPRNVKYALNTNINQLRNGVRVFEEDLRVFDDPRKLKSWLKVIKREMAAQADYDMQF
ncbi:J domain-containing protein [Luteibacter anthropi]|uniref:J domain-containing protein n=1 Tax=Luteibacter anthropi TaxID=564369 RepID=UPI002032E8D1|nr:J domain-containing protein [Luteibacter anthropi]URX63355.1 J domain-containing protein [Luteibacter anthropi]